jgi:hypothetical protein
MAVYTKIETQTATIANAGTTSGVIDLGASAVLGIAMPATITGTALTLHGSVTTGGTYGVLRASDGTALALTVAASGRYYIDPIITAGWPFIKVVMDAQGQSTAITLICRPV